MQKQDEHWDQIYSDKADEQLGWFESDTSQTLKFLSSIPTQKKAKVFLPGAGTSLLVEELLSRGHDVILNDISNTALERLKARVGSENATWLVHDVSQPLPSKISEIDIWIDRAVLHFLNDEMQIKSYFDNVRFSVKTGGYVLLAEFSENGHPKCAGLEVHKYSLEEMNMRLGKQFQLVIFEYFDFKNPSGGTRPYLYALYKKIS